MTLGVLQLATASKLPLCLLKKYVEYEKIKDMNRPTIFFFSITLAAFLLSGCSLLKNQSTSDESSEVPQLNPTLSEELDNIVPTPDVAAKPVGVHQYIASGTLEERLQKYAIETVCYPNLEEDQSKSIREKNNLQPEEVTSYLSRLQSDPALVEQKKAFDEAFTRCQKP